MKIRGKTIVITGGGNGIGRELVLLLLKKGARVAAVDINIAALKETVLLASEYQSMLSIHPVDITDRQAIEDLVEAVIISHGTVDGVINNAGIIQHFVSINDLDYSEIEHIFNTNYWGMVNVTKSFLPHLLQRPEAHIVNVSSMGGFLPVPGQTAYGASKAAVKLFTEGLHSELFNTNVHVSVVFPGATATNIVENSGVSMSARQLSSANNSRVRMTSPGKAAEIIVDGMEKGLYRILIGPDSKMMDILTRIMPERAAKLIYTQMQSLLN